MIKKFVGKTGVNFMSFYVFLFAFISIFSITEKASSQTGDTVIADSTNVSDVSHEEADSNVQESQEELVVSDDHSEDEITHGKRLFLGLLPFDRSYESCVSCHRLNPVDTLNWNPSAMDIALKYVDKDFASFQQVLMEPSGIKMEASHVNFTIEEEDLRSIKTYLNDLAHQGPPTLKPSYDNLILFLILGIILTWALIELIFLHKIKRKAIPLIIFLGAFSWQAKMIAEDAIRLGRQQNYAPDQPVKFSHKVHAGENGIDCKYCHTTAEYSKSAGIPPPDLCMNCHVLIREGTNSG